MHSLDFRSYMNRSSGLVSLSQYIESESSGAWAQGTDSLGHLLEYETLELRIHPPSVSIDNESSEDVTVITLDSANRPGTLVEVVQCLAELGLDVRQARISSDGGWFVDEFQTDRVTDAAKLEAIRGVLSARAAEQTVELNEELVFELSGTDRPGLLADVVLLLRCNDYDVRSAAAWSFNSRAAFVMSVVEPGPLCSMSGSPQNLEPGVGAAAARQGGAMPSTQDHFPAQRLQEMLHNMMSSGTTDPAVVNVCRIRGPVHHERRLHWLLLHEEEAAWSRSHGNEATVQRSVVNCCSTGSHNIWNPESNICTSGRSSRRSSMSEVSCVTDPGPSGSSCKHSPSMAPLSDSGHSEHVHRSSSLPVHLAPPDKQPPSRQSHLPGVQVAHCPLSSQTTCKPMVNVSYVSRLNYWIVTIECKDRRKLVFDTVCTLADLDYDVYHATVDVDAGVASQEYYIRPRYGDSEWKPHQGAKLKCMLEAAIQRRSFRGTKACILSWQQCDLAAQMAAWRDAGFNIIHAKVQPCLEGPAGSFSNTFYIVDARTGAAPDPIAVQRACETQAGISLTLPGLSQLVGRTGSLGRLATIDSRGLTGAEALTAPTPTHEGVPCERGLPDVKQAEAASATTDASVAAADFRLLYKGVTSGYLRPHRSSTGLSSFASS